MFVAAGWVQVDIFATVADRFWIAKLLLILFLSYLLPYIGVVLLSSYAGVIERGMRF